MPTGLPIAPRGKDCDSSTKLLLLGATIHARAAPARSSNAATGRRTSRCIKLGQPKFALLPAVPTQALRQVCNGLLSCDRFNSLTKRGSRRRGSRPVALVSDDKEPPKSLEVRPIK